MIELAAFASLLGIGWILSQRSAGEGQRHRDKLQKEAFDSQRVEDFLNSIPGSERPSGNTVYDSQHVHHARMAEEAKAAEHFHNARHPKRTGVIGRTYREDTDAENRRDKRRVKSELAGVEMDFNDFQHVNMQPFFGSRIKQNLKSGANRTLLEKFTGVEEPGMKASKHEVGPLFKMRANPDAVYGNPVNVDRHMDRFQNSRIRNNETPFEKIYVAPGLNQDGFQSHGVHGYNQVNVDNSFVLPKTVDELRVGNRKRTTYSPPVVAGKAMAQRGQCAKLYQNRPNLTEARAGTERFFVTAAGNEAGVKRPDEISAKDTERQSMPSLDIGHAVGPRATGGSAGDAAGSAKETTKQQLDDFGFRNLSVATEGLGDDFDFGKENIILPAQERDLTAEATYQGNLASLVKAIVSPITDTLRLSRKEYDVSHARTFGQLQSSVKMHVVKDPNDVARTTIKETMVGDTREGNLNMPTKPYVYDPEEIAKVTIRDTIESATRAGNVQTLQGGDAYLDANVEAKKTQKELLSDNDYFGGAFSISDSRPMSYEEFFNAEMDGGLKEETLRGRAPVYHGDKVGITTDDVGAVKTRKLGIDEDAQRQFNNMDRLTGKYKADACDAITMTKRKDQLPDASVASRILDVSQLAGLQSNPFAMKPMSVLASGVNCA